jgi:hypothetical protein
LIALSQRVRQLHPDLPNASAHGFTRRDLWTHMTTTSELKGGAAQPHPNIKMARNSQIRKAKASGFRDPDTMLPQNAQRNYERYLSLARAEALSGDPIAAENYFQHAEHYLRSMPNDRPTSRPDGRS